MYTVIQWKTVPSVLQSGNWMNRTVEAKVRTIKKTMIPTEEYGNDLITELHGVRLTVFLCTLEVSAMQSVYDEFSASLYAAYR